MSEPNDTLENPERRRVVRAGALGLAAAMVSQTVNAGAPLAPLTQPREEQLLQRIAFGSCADQDKPQPIWDAIIESQPDLFIFLACLQPSARG